VADKRNPKDIVTFEDLTLSNVWELEALIAILERKGVITKPEILDMTRNFATRTLSHCPASRQYPERAEAGHPHHPCAQRDQFYGIDGTAGARSVGASSGAG